MRVPVSPYFRIEADGGGVYAVFVDGTVVPLLEPTFEEPGEVEMLSIDTTIAF